jgi:hypothetical protein
MSKDTNVTTNKLEWAVNQAYVAVPVYILIFPGMVRVNIVKWI